MSAQRIPAMVARLSVIGLFLALLFPAATALAGPWTHERGKGYFEFAGRAVRTTTYFNDAGTALDIPTLGDYTLSLYGEYGLFDRLTLVAYVPLVRRITVNKVVGRQSGTVYSPGGENTALGDAQLGARLKLWSSASLVSSLDVQVGLPIGDSSDSIGLVTGDGEFNVIATAGVGYSLYPLPAYVAAHIGANLRTAGFSHEARYGLEAGWTFFERLTVSLRLWGVEPLARAAPISGVDGGFFAVDQRYLAWAPQVAYQFGGGFGLSASLQSAALTRNVAGGPAYALALYYKP